MARLVSITVVALVDDDTPADSLADVVINIAVAPVAEWAEINGWSVELLDAIVTLDIEEE